MGIRSRDAIGSRQACQNGEGLDERVAGKREPMTLTEAFLQHIMNTPVTSVPSRQECYLRKQHATFQVAPRATLAANAGRHPASTAGSTHSVDSGALTQLNPAELRADLVIALHEDERPTLGVVLEMQRERDDEKLFSWPAYVWIKVSGPGRRNSAGPG
jgi:hypothetical protein